MLNFPYSLRLNLLGPGFLTCKFIRSKILSFQQPIRIVSASLNETENGTWERKKLHNLLEAPGEPQVGQGRGQLCAASAVLSLPLVWLFSAMNTGTMP